MKLPIVQPFTIQSLGWEFVDKRSLDPKVAGVPYTLWLAEVRRVMQRNAALNAVLLCGQDQRKRDRAVARLEQEKETRPDLDWETFVGEGGDVEEEFDCDRRLPDLFLFVRETSGPWVGGVSISNIRIARDGEREGGGPLKASGFFLAGVPKFKTLSMPRTWRRIYRYILNNALHLENGRRLFFVQYNFLSSPKMRETMNQNPNIKNFIDLMREDFDIRGDGENRTEHIRFRSKTADDV